MRRADESIEDFLATSAHSFGESEVADFGSAKAVRFFGQQNVFWLHVAMNESRAVGGGETVSNLGRDSQSLGRCQSQSRVEHFLQGVARDEFHLQEMQIVVLADGVCHHDVWMMQVRDGDCLLAKPIDVVGIGLDVFRREDFERATPFQLLMQREVHGSHRSTSEQGVAAIYSERLACQLFGVNLGRSLRRRWLVGRRSQRVLVGLGRETRRQNRKCCLWHVQNRRAQRHRFAKQGGIVKIFMFGSRFRQWTLDFLK